MTSNMKGYVLYYKGVYYLFIEAYLSLSSSGISTLSQEYFLYQIVVSHFLSKKRNIFEHKAVVYD